MPARASYLEANDAFYEGFWRTAPHYRARFPNAEESTRGGVILRLLARLAEREGWAEHPARILDAGCGRGWLTNLVSVFGHAEGCEPVGDAARVAQSLFPSLTFHAVTPGELAAAPGFIPFDVVVCSEVMEHVPEALQAAFLGDLHRCLRRGGTLVLTTPRGEMQRLAGDSSQQYLEAWRTEAEVETLLRGAGFSTLERYRAFPSGGTLVDRIGRRMPHAVWRRLRASWFQAAVDHETSVYQIWCGRCD